MEKHWPDWVNLILGVWLLVSPFLLGFSAQGDAMWNALIAGALIALVALGAMFKFHILGEGLNFLLGLWLVVSPWALGFSAFGTATWNHAIAGILVALFAVWQFTQMEGWRRMRV